MTNNELPPCPNCGRAMAVANFDASGESNLDFVRCVGSCGFGERRYVASRFATNRAMLESIESEFGDYAEAVRLARLGKAVEWLVANDAEVECHNRVIGKQMKTDQPTE